MNLFIYKLFINTILLIHISYEYLLKLHTTSYKKNLNIELLKCK